MNERTKKLLGLRIALLALLIIGFVSLFIYWQSQKSLVLPEPPLKELATAKGIDLGNFSIKTRINEPKYRQILTSQFNVGLIDNTPNWYFTDGGLRPSRTEYNFGQMDEVLAYNEKYGLKSQAHHFVWGEEKWLPDWLKKGDFSKSELDVILEDHIQTVGARYSGRIAEWTVVNEAFSRDQHVFGLRDWWADATGDSSYIDKSFLWARQADPKAKLILNDFMNESINDISNAMYEYIKSAKTRGIPIDGIGMQMHIDGGHPPTKDEVISNMKRFSELGVGVYITELDVNMNDVKADAKSKDAISANIYYEMARACIESKVCQSLSILGITDKESWYNYMGLPDARPLLFDKKYQPKPSFYALRQAFLE